MVFKYYLITLILLTSQQCAAAVGTQDFMNEIENINNDKTSPKSFETILSLIKDNIYDYNIHESKNNAINAEAMRKLIKKEVPNKTKQKELLNWVKYYETIVIFLKEIAGGDPKKALALLNKNPYLATIKDPITNHTPLSLIIKNYSFTSLDEEKLLKKIILLNPQAVVYVNFHKNNSTIWEEIGTFTGHKERYDLHLVKIVQDVLKNIKISNELKKQFADALSNKNYEVVINLFNQNPQLAYFQDADKKTLLDYINEANGKLKILRIPTTLLIS